MDLLYIMDTKFYKVTHGKIAWLLQTLKLADIDDFFLEEEGIIGWER